MIKKPPGPAIRKPAPGKSDSNTKVRRQEILLKTGALQSTIFSITDSRADPTPWPQRSGNTAKDRE